MSLVDSALDFALFNEEYRRPSPQRMLETADEYLLDLLGSIASTEERVLHESARAEIRAAGIPVMRRLVEDRAAQFLVPPDDGMGGLLSRYGAWPRASTDWAAPQTAVTGAVTALMTALVPRPHQISPGLSQPAQGKFVPSLTIF